MSLQTGLDETFQIPDFFSLCPFQLMKGPSSVPSKNSSYPFPLGRKYPHSQNCRALKIELLASMCYSTAEPSHLQVVNHILKLMLYLRDLSTQTEPENFLITSEEIIRLMLDGGKPVIANNNLLARLWKRLQRASSPFFQDTLMKSIERLIYSLHQRCCDRLSFAMPDLESYISWRRESSGCNVMFLLIQHAYNLDLPPAILQDSVIQQLTLLANDLISWSNDVYSYNVDQHGGNLHNIVSIIGYSNSLTVQESIDYVSSLYSSTTSIFLDLIQELPSWGDKLDSQVAVYIRGLQDCIVGALHWSFESDRYFGDENSRKVVRETRVVTLLPTMFG